MNINTELLKEIGLTDGEIKVYLALINLNSSTTGNIIKDSKVHASKVYPILDRLITKGLVSFIKEGKKKIFSANPPTTIISFLDRKEKQIEKQKDEAKKLIEQLEALKEFKKETTEATLFRGLRGFEVALNEFISKTNRKDYVNIVGVTDFKPSFKRRFLDSLTEFSKVRMIIDEEKASSSEMQLPNVEMKLVPKGNAVPSLIYTSNDLVLISVNEGDTTFFIQNKEMAKSFTSYFENFWRSNTRTYVGNDGVRKAIKEIIEQGIANKEIINFGISFTLFSTLLPKEASEFKNAFIKHNFSLKTLLPENEKQKLKLSEIRYLPEAYLSPSKILISGDKAFFIEFSEPITTIIIENQEMVHRYKEHFEAQWKIAQP